MNHYEPARLVSLGIAFTISLVLVFGSVLLSLTVMNVALAVNMPDAPVTQDTVTAGNDGNDDNEDDEGNDQPDDLPDPEDAPVTTDTITSGENEGSKENKGNEENSDKADGTNVEDENDIEITPRQNCSRYQEPGLFGSCVTIQDCPNPIEAEVGPELEIANEGDYASQCVPPLEFGNTGNFQQSEQTPEGGVEDFESGGLEFSFEAESSAECAQISCPVTPTATPTPAPLTTTPTAPAPE